MPPKNFNHLAGQKNPYLMQHVDNPVDWYPWGQEALQKAVAEDKPILLSIGYSTCHWCHVMAHESFENEEIADFINTSFIAIKVDREERPDLDQIYMTAVTAMTGQGGWPLTVFLTPQGKPFFGGTYFPPQAKWGSPGFLDLLNTIAQAWANQRSQVLTSSEEITRLLAEQSQKYFISSQIPGVSLLQAAYRQIASQFDDQNGGFGKSPKFPMGHYLLFLMRFYQRNRDPKILNVVEFTLKAIAKGGICDQLGGGFHRYSTDPYWHVPHFEKMLYDQALLVKAYIEAYQLTGDQQYASIAKQTLDYVLRELQHPQGGFYCAEDADSAEVDSGHKTEGTYYVWSMAEIKSLLEAKEAEIFNYAFGVKEQGNAQFDPHGEFVGKNILYAAHSLEETASHFQMMTQEVDKILKSAKLTLLSTRNHRPHPHLDEKILTDWNGLMLGVLAFAGAVLEQPLYISAAQKAADFILANFLSQGKLLHCSIQGEISTLGTLEDYAFFINGLLDLYEACLDEKYLEQAQTLAKDMIDLFEDHQQGGFYLTSAGLKDLIVRPKEVYDGAIPSGNSIAVYSLLRIYLLTSQDLGFVSSCL